MMAAQWERTKFLGKGSYGCVFLAKPLYSSSGNSPVLAVKSSSEYAGIASLQTEKNILYELRGCPEIVQCFGEDFSVDEKGREVYSLLLEYAHGGTVDNLLEFSSGRISEYEASCYANMLLKGLSHVHEEGYVHCDIKPSNVLLFPSITGKLKNFLKPSNFGLTKRAGEKTNVHRSLKYRGTLMYSSPELVILGEHEAPMDIWSLGCVMVEVLVGVSFWSSVIGNDVNNLTTYENTWLECLFVEYSLSKNAMDFLRRCLKRDVRERWTADQLLQHTFITDYLKTWMPLKAEREMAYPKTPFNSSFVSKLSLICYIISTLAVDYLISRYEFLLLILGENFGLYSRETIANFSCLGNTELYVYSRANNN